MYSTSFLDLPPIAHAQGTVRLPGSKSISNRVLLLAGMAAGATRIEGLLEADDTQVMRDALLALGCRLQQDGEALVIEGLAGTLPVHTAELFLGNAGTAMRPLAAALAVLATRHGGAFTLAGTPRMHERPIADLLAALRPLGCPIAELGTPGYPPLRVGDGAPHPLDLARPIRVRGDVSSQFLTALLMALPLAGSAQPVVIEVDGPLISAPYIDITLALMARFGVSVEAQGHARFVLPAGARYTAPGRLHVEGDASGASYFMALGAIAGGPVRIEGLGLNALQGDIRFVDTLRAMGAIVEGGQDWLAVRRGAWPLRAVTLDADRLPDAAMTLAPLALFADGPCRLTGIASWRVKETDRIAAMATELRKVGAGVAEGPDWLTITPPRQWQAARLATYDDHRMAMCLALAACNPAGLPMRIEDPRCVGKTFPDYFETLFALTTPVADSVPVLTVDGPTASGKGTLAAALAATLGYHLLDSGALYRATALAAHQAGVALSDGEAVARIAATLPLRFDGERVWLAGADVTHALRLETTGELASQVSVHPPVRAALTALQLSFRRAPGLVADGRDMGTVIFPGATLKVFLTAGSRERALRRQAQLQARGVHARIEDLHADIEARDARDRSRASAPLKPAEDALLLDNSALGVTESVAQVLDWWQQRRPFAA
ncbi:MAG: bifunctional 3-phosphoshikimate 1-carboxyvinyltransferase/cytidylate kinase [Proteobacteria bacterium]|nr:bifunctional 3-phosphoshikimate 1-carboxyvinyltransferase/cytidylate kinase [Pseudomonadota bacterium]